MELEVFWFMSKIYGPHVVFPPQAYSNIYRLLHCPHVQPWKILLYVVYPTNHEVFIISNFILM